MNLLCKLALIAIPYNLISVAWVQLDLLHHVSPKHIKENFGNTTLLIIAHPDDETMFFGPLVLSLLQQKRYLHILCLSKGNADDQGDIREKELAKVVESLGPNASVKLINDVQLKDGLSVQWDRGVIIKYIKDCVLELQNHGLQTLVTFDSYGVSGHPNHRAIHEAIVEFKNMNSTSGVKFLNLRTVNIFRKYISFIDAIFTYPPKMKATYRSQEYFKGDSDDVILALDFDQNAKLRELLNMHVSQMVWFRKLYMFFSRNMFLNNLSFV
jgi:N-acetylglucosaminylphosphatidylinositol deacetylase